MTHLNRREGVMFFFFNLPIISFSWFSVRGAKTGINCLPWSLFSIIILKNGKIRNPSYHVSQSSTKCFRLVKMEDMLRESCLPLPRARKGEERGKMSHARGNAKQGKRCAEVKGSFLFPFLGALLLSSRARFPSFLPNAWLAALACL